MAAQTFTAFTPEIWTPKINFFFKEKLVAAPFFLDYSADVSQGGDIVHIPNISDAFSPADIATTNGSVTSTDLSDTNTNLTINNWKGVAYDLTDFQWSQVLKSYNIKKQYAMSMGHSLARNFDTALLALGSSLTPTVGNTSTDLLATTLESAFAIMESNSIPREDTVLILHPKVYWKNIMPIQKYYDASQYGKNVIPQGAHSMLYGVPVVLSTNVPAGTGGGYVNILANRRAFVYAFGKLDGAGQNGVRIQEKPSEDLKVRFIGDLIYGVKLLNATAGVQILANG